MLLNDKLRKEARALKLRVKELEKEVLAARLQFVKRDASDLILERLREAANTHREFTQVQTMDLIALLIGYSKWRKRKESRLTWG